MAVKAIVVNNRFIHKKMYYIYIGGYGVQQEKDRYLYINTSITLCYLKEKTINPWTMWKRFYDSYVMGKY